MQWIQIGVGAYHTCALRKSDNTAWCWGYNDKLQLGVTNATVTAAPVAVQGGYKFKQLSVGGYHACGIGLDDDKMYCCT